MSELRIILVDGVRSADESFTKPFEQLEDVTVIDTVWSWDALGPHLLSRAADVIAVNLDVPQGLDIVHKISRQSPEFGLVGISSNTEAMFIIKAMRAGCGQFVCAPIDTEDLINALRRVQPVRPKSDHAPRLICVVGSSGGAGATTVTCNLAMELSHLTSQQIALVDLNMEYGDVACNFDCTVKYTLADVTAGNEEIDAETIQSAVHELPCGVSIIARPNHLEEAREVMPDRVDLMFELLSETYPFVLVDLPRSYGFLNSVAVGRADHILIVTQLSVPAIRNATRVQDALLQLGASSESVQIVVNRYKAEFERITLKEVEDHFRRSVFAVIPNDYKYVSAALDFGHPIGAEDPDNKCRAAIQEIARKIAPEYSNTQDDKSPDGFFGKLLGRRPRGSGV